MKQLSLRELRGEENIPDASAILDFRHLLEAHQLSSQLFTEINVLLHETGLLLRAGTMVDATLSPLGLTKRRDKGLAKNTAQRVLRIR